MAAADPSFRRNRPLVQNLIAGLVILIAGLVIFGTVGIYVAIVNLGAGAGKADSEEMNYIVSALSYGIFALAGFFSGSFINRFGPRLALVLGSVGYPCYVTGLLLFDRFDLLVLPIVGAVIIGFGGALLWAAVNYVAMSYADEHEKGRFYGFQAAMSAFGNFVASCLVLGINVDDNAADGVPLSVYLTFIAVMCIAVVVALLLVQPSAVRRKDGSALAIYQQETMMQELVNVSKLVFDWKAMALCPALFVAEYCLILQPGISSLYFDLRTRSLCAVISGILSLLGAIGMGSLLDFPGLSRSTRGKIGFSVLAALTLGIYAGEAGWLFSVIPQTEPASNPAYDWTSPEFPGFFILYELFGVLGAVGPVFTGWVFASLTNDPKRSGHYAGLIRSVMAGGVCIAFGIAAGGVTTRHQFIVHIVLQFLALIPQGFVVFTQVNETNYGLEGTVIVPKKVADQLADHEHDGSYDLAAKGLAEEGVQEVKVSC